MPAVLNAANEVAVDAFLKKQITFLQIPQIIHEVMARHICINRPSLDEIIGIDEWARVMSRQEVQKQ